MLRCPGPGLCSLLLFGPIAISSAPKPGLSVPAITPAPKGPYRVAGNRILDRDNRPYLIRGTRLAPLEGDRDEEKGSVATAFGPLSRTTLVTIRHRLNMNAVRLPISPADYTGNAEYRARTGRVVQRANQLELLVILESGGAPADAVQFWTRVAADFADRPNVFFAVLSAALIGPIRQAGAAQPVILAGIGPEPMAPENRNVIYQVTPRYLDLKTDQDRRRLFASAAARVPVLVDGLDPEFGTASEECAAFPGDPTAATALVEANLAYFDAQQISWTASSFTPGKLITDFRYFNGTKLDPGWTCGQASEAGLGMVLLAHLWKATPLGLLTVSESRGGLVVARGGVSTAYGPILADEDVQATENPLPTRLGNISIRITDARGVVRLAPLLHVLAGWGSISFVIPEECATGPAEVAVVRTDGSAIRSRVLIADLAPAVFTVPPDGRSVAFAHVT
jgi:hypothetical protein